MQRSTFPLPAQRQSLSLLLSLATMTIALPPSFGCCSLHPAEFSAGQAQPKSSGTKGLAAEAYKDGKIVHLLGYQNSPVNLNAKGANAMLLPIPAKPGTMSEANILDTKSCKQFLVDIEKAVMTPPRTRGFSEHEEVSLPASRVIVFDHDIYTIVLAQNAEDIPKALQRVPADKRPSPNKSIFDSYQKWYKGWTFALCCFNNKQQADASPMLWWYEPLEPRQLFFPAVDAHDGHSPRLDGKVAVDHTVAFSSYLMQDSPNWKNPLFSQGKFVLPEINKVSYTNEWEIDKAVRELLPKRVVGQRFEGKLPQGDFVCGTQEVRDGVCLPRRKLPPGAITNR